MKNSKSAHKRESLHENVQASDNRPMDIQPFKEMPSNNAGEGEARITAHELFSHYTSDVIKQDIVYAR